jgi:hypothetical protein
MSGRALSSNGNFAIANARCNSHHLKVGHVAEQTRQRVTHDIVVINDQYSIMARLAFHPRPWCRDKRRADWK